MCSTRVQNEKPDLGGFRIRAQQVEKRPPCQAQCPNTGNVRGWIGLNTRNGVRKGQHRVGLVFMAEKKLGNTLYRNGKRIAIRWQLLVALGAVLAEGPMRYG